MLNQAQQDCPDLNLTQHRKWNNVTNMKGIIAGESLLKGIVKTVAPVAVIGAAPFVLPAIAPAVLKVGTSVAGKVVGAVTKAGAGATGAPEDITQVEQPQLMQASALAGIVPIALMIAAVMAVTLRR
jgi:hypothetical protein